jgi:alkanesulfonate monooxygenase SsuD/methylene tetrahydromethanopterin reductase-like flavin-dependent oxidoreductase (luciferase family)
MEEICMLDHLSGGRLDVGIGRGASPYELEYYGVAPAQAAAIYKETHAVLIAALTHRTLTFEGEFHTFRDVPIEIEPLQRPHPPFWYGVVNTDGAAWAARNRINVVCNGPTDLVRSLSDCYRAAWLEAGNAIADMPLFGMNRYLVLAERDGEAMTIARRAYKHWHYAFYYLWEKRGGKPAHISALYPDTFDEAQSRGYAVAGTPEQVRDTLVMQTAEGRNNYLVCRFAFGDLRLEESLRSLDLFTRKVAPAFV